MAQKQLVSLIIRDFKQIATASSTTATGSIFFKNWDSA